MRADPKRRLSGSNCFSSWRTRKADPNQHKGIWTMLQSGSGQQGDEVLPLSPARWLAEDAERGLANDLVDQAGIGRMDRAQRHVAQQPFQLI